MAALSPAQANEASLWLVIFLAVLLAASLAAVIMSPLRPGSPSADRADAESGLPEPGHEPYASPRQCRIGGRHRAAYLAGGPARRPGTIWLPQASGGPPWGPAPKPPVVPSQEQYGGQVIDTSTGRTWCCPRNHPTPESATRCADAMQERIKRLGRDKATGSASSGALGAKASRAGGISAVAAAMSRAAASSPAASLKAAPRGHGVHASPTS